MKAKINAAQVGFGQLGEPWYHYVSGNYNWNVDLYKNIKDFNPKNYDVVFLAVKDSSLIDIIQKLKDTGTPLVHFSGGLYSKEAFGLHPVYSFSKSKIKVNFKTLDWVIDSNKVPQFIQNLLGESIYMISPERKKAYHNYLSVSANMSQLLSYLMGERFKQQTELPPNILKTLVLQSIESEKEQGVKSFSGPWVRGEKNLQDTAIENLKDNFLSLENKHFNSLIEVYDEHNKV